MSNSCETVENKNLAGIEVNPAIIDKLPFPSDYKFSPCFLPKRYLTKTKRIEHFAVRSDDVWVVTFPKAGTTWTMNIVWQLMNNLDFTAEFLSDEDMFFEYHAMISTTDEILLNKLESEFKMMENLSSPRLFKSHLPAYLLPKDIWMVKPKIVYVYRDAKDVAISMYHMHRNHTRLNFQGTIDEFFDRFLNGQVYFGPYNAHVESFQVLKELEHILLIKFEDMVADPFAGVKKISEFLGFEYTDEQLKKLAKHVSFGNMRKNLRSFFRQGTSGGFRNEMRAEYIQKFTEMAGNNATNKSSE